MLGGDESFEEIDQSTGVAHEHILRSNLFVSIEIVIIAKRDRDSGGAMSRSLDGRGFTGSGIEQAALDADALFLGGGHEHGSAFAIENRQAISHTHHRASAHDSSIHRTAGFDGKENGIIAERPFLRQMPSAEETDFFSTRKGGMERGAEIQRCQLPEGGDDDGATDKVITGRGFDLFKVDVYWKIPGGDVAFGFTTKTCFDPSIDFRLTDATEEGPVGFRARSADKTGMVHVSPKDPCRSALGFAVFVGGQKIAKFIALQLHIGAIFEKRLDFVAHMIFVERRGRLFQNSLENVREVGHCHNFTVTTFYQQPTANVKNIRYFFETALVATAAWLLPRLPRWLVMALARGIGRVAYLADARGRRTARENLRAAFAGKLSEKEVRRITLGSYQNFARTFLDLFWCTALKPENWQKHISFRMDDPEAEAKARATGAVWVTPHYGNFEFVSLIWGFRGVPFTIVAQDFKNASLTAIFRRLREHTGHTVISQENAMLKLMKALKRQGHAGLLTDLNIKPGRAATVIECFGLKTCVPTLHVELARRLGLSMITGVCQPLPDGRYEARIFEAIQPGPEDDVTALTQRVWDGFEKAIRETPECWLWMYKHWRYLPTLKRDAKYPSYANPHVDFRELITERRKSMSEKSAE